jgi:hypothetical protein
MHPICNNDGTEWLYEGRDSSVGIATRYRLEGPGFRIPVGGGKIFRTRPDRP